MTQSTATATADSPPAADDSRRWIALYVLCTGMLMIVLDMTVVNVALPAIQDDLGFTTSSLAWVVNAYLIAFGGLLLLSGRLGDLLGRRRVFFVGLVVFITASVICGFAQSQEMLVGARFLQGIGGALTSAVILGMIVTMFPKPADQAKALGVYAFVASAGGSVGLLAGGILTQSINYHWIFFINIPIGIATALFARRLLDPDEGIGWGKGADIPGAVLITSSLMLGVYTIVGPAAENGWGDPQTLLLGALSLGLLGAFIGREATAKAPLIPLGIFRSRNVTGANMIQALSISGMFALFFLGSLYMQRILGYDALQIGFAFLPTTLAMGTMSIRYSDRLVMRFGPRSTLIPGLFLIMLGLILFTRAPVEGDYWTHVLPTMLVLGIGAGMSFPALMKLAMTGATGEDAGLASGLVNTTAQVGAALGLAVLATLAASHTESVADGGDVTSAALNSGYHEAFWIGAALVGAAIVVAFTVLQPDEKNVQALETHADGAPGPESNGGDPAREHAYSEAA